MHNFEVFQLPFHLGCLDRHREVRLYGNDPREDGGWLLKIRCGDWPKDTLIDLILVLSIVILYTYLDTKS